MNIQLIVTVELRRESGKFASREEVLDALRESVEQAAGEDIYGVGADGDSIYLVDDLSVEEHVTPKKKDRRGT